MVHEAGTSKGYTCSASFASDAGLRIASAVINAEAIPLSCAIGGPTNTEWVYQLTNATGHVIPKGSTVRWSSANPSRGGSVVIDADFAPNATVSFNTSAGFAPASCNASFFPVMDLQIASVGWTSATSASVVVVNASPWVDAPATTTNVRRMDCIQSPIGTGFDQSLPTAALPKGGRATLVVNVAKQPGLWLRAIANYSPSGTPTPSTMGHSAEWAQCPH
jgi:hypothetical protein